LEKGIKYVHSRFPMLERVPLELVVLKPGDDFSNVERGKGYVGYSLHEVQRVHVENKKGGERFTVGLSKNRSGSITTIKYNKRTDEIENYFVFFGAGNEAAVSPISEPLHLSLTKFTQIHFDRLGGFDKSQTAEESLIEGISFMIWPDFAREAGISEWEGKIEKAKRDMKKEPRYRFVPASIAWLRRNSIERGIEIYMENPKKYLEAIQKQ
jgi:hypothetical protein